MHLPSNLTRVHLPTITVRLQMSYKMASCMAIKVRDQGWGFLYHCKELTQKDSIVPTTTCVCPKTSSPIHTPTGHVPCERLFII